MIRLLAAFACSATFIIAQCAPVPLPTTLAGGNSSEGTMFDVVNVSAAPVQILSFDQSWSGTGMANRVEIYSKPGSWQGYDNNPAAWGLVGTASNVTHSGNTYVHVPIPVDVTIPAGATRAWYITTDGDPVSYTTGNNQLGSVIGTDGTLAVHAGVGEAYLFGATYGLPTNGRLWNGRVNYASVGAVPSFQVNTPSASLDVNGNTTTGCGPALVNQCIGLPATLHLASTNVGSGYEILLSQVPLVAGGSYLTSHGQLVNIDLLNPTTTFLFGLTFPAFAQPFGTTSPVSVTIPMPDVFLITAQMAVLDSSHPDGFRLSQGVEIHGMASGSAPGPRGLDNGTWVTAGTPIYPFGPCFFPPPLPFYGVMRNAYYLSENGRITFPGADDYPQPSNFLNSVNGFVGCWSAFVVPVNNPASHIDLSTSGSTFTATWVNVLYANQPSSIVSNFSISVDGVTGVITISGINNLGTALVPPPPYSWPMMFVGTSRGAGATDPGPVPFGIGSGATTNSTAAVYRMDWASPNVANGATTVVLTPNAFNNYDWHSY